jgi:hypothetical protein
MGIEHIYIDNSKIEVDYHFKIESIKYDGCKIVLSNGLKQIHLNLNDDKLCENNDYIDDDL